MPVFDVVNGTFYGLFASVHILSPSLLSLKPFSNSSLLPALRKRSNSFPSLPRLPRYTDTHSLSIDFHHLLIGFTYCITPYTPCDHLSLSSLPLWPPSLAFQTLAQSLPSTTPKSLLHLLSALLPSTTPRFQTSRLDPASTTRTRLSTTTTRREATAKVCMICVGGLSCSRRHVLADQFPSPPNLLCSYFVHLLSHFSATFRNLSWALFCPLKPRSILEGRLQRQTHPHTRQKQRLTSPYTASSLLSCCLLANLMHQLAVVLPHLTAI